MSSFPMLSNTDWKAVSKNNIGNTARPLCVRCKVSFFVRVHKFDAGGLTPGKENLCAMTEKMQADDVQRR